MMALSGVRSSWDMFARNCDLCWLAISKLAALFLELLEQPGVLDGDDGLIRERLQQRDLLLGERTDLQSPQHECPDRSVVTDQRHRQHGAITGDTWAAGVRKLVL